METNTTVQDWTSLTPAASIAISVTSTHTAIQSECNRRERKRITVDADNGLATQHRGSRIFVVENLGMLIT